MKAWETSPYTTVVVDFEYNIGLFPVLQHNAVWEIAIANANGDWVVPPVVINHEMPMLELSALITHHTGVLNKTGPTSIMQVSEAMIPNQLERFYGSSAPKNVPSLTWAEIADQLDTY